MTTERERSVGFMQEADRCTLFHVETSNSLYNRPNAPINKATRLLAEEELKHQGQQTEESRSHREALKGAPDQLNGMSSPLVASHPPTEMLLLLFGVATSF